MILVPVILKVVVKRALILGAQALFAAVAEEEFALTTDKFGFRGRDGQFKSKKHAIIRALIGFTVIAAGVQIVPPVLTTIFPFVIPQTFGLCVAVATVLVHRAVDAWRFTLIDKLVVAAGVLLTLGPYTVYIV